MRAAVYEGYGGAERLEIRELPEPRPADNEILVRVRATSVNPIDWRLRRGMLRPVMRLSFPFVPGCDLAGEVEAVGEAVEGLSAGDRIWAMVDPRRGGAAAQRTTVPAAGAARMPSTLSFEEAAAVPLVGLTALQVLRDKGKIFPGARVLIHGASGGVGSLAVQVARILGAGHVTGVASGGNRELLEELGVDEAIDYTAEEFTERDERWDLVFDAVGMSSFSRCAGSLTRRGVYVSTLPGPGLLLALLGSRALGVVGYGKRAEMLGMVQASGEDLATLATWVEGGRLRPVLERIVPLEEIRSAHEASEGGHTRGKIVVRVP